ncbi:MAG: hypothetical protein ACFFAL_08675 [Promethearchaeota archaeon]
MTQTREQILHVAKDFDDAIVSSSWINRKIIQKIIKESIKGLE